MTDFRSIRPMASDLHATQAPYPTSLTLPGSNPQCDLPANRSFRPQVPPPAPQQSPESQANMPDDPDSEIETSSSSNSSNHTSPASSNPIDSEVTRHDDTMSVLHIASHRCHAAIVSILLKHNLDLNEPDGSGRPPLHLAAMNGHPAVISLLLSHGAYINTIDSRGRKALHWAVQRGHETVVQVFLDAGGADRNLRDRNDWCLAYRCGAGLRGHFEDVIKAWSGFGAEAKEG